MGIRAAESLAGARSKFFFRGPYFKNFFGNKIFRTTTSPPPPPRRQLFRENFFPDEHDVIAFQRLYLNFVYQISLLCRKKQISCTLRGYISSKKITGAQQKMGPPRTWGPGAICPPPLAPPLGGPDGHLTPFLRHFHVVFDVASSLLNLSVIMN